MTSDSSGTGAARPPTSTGSDPSAHALFMLASSCAAVALLATALFFLLHYVGNQLPYDLAVERFQAELESEMDVRRPLLHRLDRPDPGHARGYKNLYEYCEVSSAVLAGARGAREVDVAKDSAFRSAVVLKVLSPETWAHPCDGYEAALLGDVVPERIAKLRYWFGSKALYAVALRWHSVYEIREFTRIATYVAYLLLAVSLFLLSPKMLLLAAPLVAFGAFFSGVEYWADVANGLPYLWTVLFATGLAIFTGLTRRGVGSGTKRGRYRETDASSAVAVYCFAGGTVSSYLWLGDGHTFLAATWIGMVVWFGSGALDVAERTRKTMLCIALYGAGIVVCYVLGQVVKDMFLGSDSAWSGFWHGLVGAVQKSIEPPGSTLYPSYLSSFYSAYWPVSWPSRIVPTTVAASALAVSLGLAAVEARRGRSLPLWSVLWIVGLMAGCSLTFLIAEDFHYRTARYVFVPLALCFSCLLLSLLTMHWRMSLATACKHAAVLLGVIVVAAAVSRYVAALNSRAVAEIIESVGHLRPLASSTFDVYLDEDRLVYVKEECGDEDVLGRFFLHFYPSDIADLPVWRRPTGYDNLDFFFWRSGLRSGGRCAVQRPIPNYEIAVIHTGQLMPAARGRWGWYERIIHPAAVDNVIRSVEGMRPAARSAFDIYLDGNRLVYVKEECSREDVDAVFSLHILPADVADLPRHRIQHGFDNLDFLFETFGFRVGGRCAAVRLLPDYGIVSIRTGQFVPGKGGRSMWHERIIHPAAFDNVISSVEGMRPAARSAFNVYLNGNRLVYVKEECSREDVDAVFFLHILPADVADLPRHRIQHGFDNLDFLFETFGFRVGGRCAVLRLLPDYGIASIRTGQFVPGKGPVWSERISPKASR